MWQYHRLFGQYQGGKAEVQSWCWQLTPRRLAADFRLLSAAKGSCQKFFQLYSKLLVAHLSCQAPQCQVRLLRCEACCLYRGNVDPSLVLRKRTLCTSIWVANLSDWNECHTAPHNSLPSTYTSCTHVWKAGFSCVTQPFPFPCRENEKRLLSGELDILTG